MKCYLTSTVFNTRCEIYKKNSLLKNLKNDWKNDSVVLYIASNPDAYEITDKYYTRHRKAFMNSGLSIKEMILIDGRNVDKFEKLFKKADVIYLAGGHCPTEIKFFKKLKLKEKLKDFKGIVMGTSAGTMNAQDIVYAQPEEMGEAIDPNYKRFYKGLGLTNIMILPHYQEYKNHVLDGLRVFEDISYPDSMGRKFYCLTDGSYLRVENGVQTLFGEYYLLSDAKLAYKAKTGDKTVIK